MTKEELQKLVREEGSERNFSYKGFECHIRRFGNGDRVHLCGYVVIPECHWAYGKEYDFITSVADISVHGGLTFAGDSIEPGSWWIGFDCAHCMDISSLDELGQPWTPNSSYRDMPYVENELKQLVEQIIAVEYSEVPQKFIITREQALSSYITLSDLIPLPNDHD